MSMHKWCQLQGLQFTIAMCWKMNGKYTFHICKDLCKTIFHVKVNVSQLQDTLRLLRQDCLCRVLLYKGADLSPLTTCLIYFVSQHYRKTCSEITSVTKTVSPDLILLQIYNSAHITCRSISWYKSRYIYGFPRIERDSGGLIQRGWPTAQGPITGVTRPNKASEQPARPLELPDCEPKTRSKTQSLIESFSMKWCRTRNHADR
ncbi:hypothetical protein PROFUN_17092, partial [Planoprotostelium fungivorum]